MNAYPGWRMSGSSYDLPPGPNKIDDIYESKQDKQRKFYDNYYAEMSWRERDKIHKEYVKQKSGSRSKTLDSEAYNGSICAGKLGEDREGSGICSKRKAQALAPSHCHRDAR
jgi:hypothetical protein